jgi:hypothetical protein
MLKHLKFEKPYFNTATDCSVWLGERHFTSRVLSSSEEKDCFQYVLDKDYEELKKFLLVSKIDKGVFGSLLTSPRNSSKTQKASVDEKKKPTYAMKALQSFSPSDWEKAIPPPPPLVRQNGVDKSIPLPAMPTLQPPLPSCPIPATPALQPHVPSSLPPLPPMPPSVAKAKTVLPMHAHASALPLPYIPPLQQNPLNHMQVLKQQRAKIEKKTIELKKLKIG